MFTLGIISLPVVYGANILEQEFIVTNGISEACILGLDAADKHELIFDGRSKTIFLARDKSEDHLIVNQDGAFPAHRETVNAVMVSTERVIIAPMSSQIVEAKIQGKGDSLITSPLFLFSQSKDLPEGIYISNFFNAMSKSGKYQIVVENKYCQAHSLKRNSLLGEIDPSCYMVGKVSTSQDLILQEEKSMLECPLEPDVDPQYQKPLTAILNEFKELFTTKDSGLGTTGLI